MDQNEYRRFIGALALADGQPGKTYAAMEDLARRAVGAKIFSIMTADTARKLSQRVHSSHPAIYPVGGTKSYGENAWSETTLNRRQIFVVNTIEDMSRTHSDHEQILALGCQSLISIPVVVNGSVIGVLNCLDERDHYTPDRVRDAELLMLPGAICLLLHARQVASAGQGV